MSKKITQLPAASQANYSDLFEKTNDPSGSPVSQKVTAQQVFDLFFAGLTTARTGLDDGVIIENAAQTCKLIMFDDGRMYLALDDDSAAIEIAADGTVQMTNIAGSGVIVNPDGTVKMTGNTGIGITPICPFMTHVGTDLNLCVQEELGLVTFSAINDSNSANKPIKVKGSTVTVVNQDSLGMLIDANADATFDGNLIAPKVMTQDTNDTVAFNSDKKDETIYDDDPSTIASLTITLPTTTIAGQILRYVNSGAATSVTIDGSVIVGADVTALVANSSVAWQAVNDSGDFVRIQ